jgi:hypothetical protein
MDCAAIPRVAGALEQNQSNSAHGAIVQGASYLTKEALSVRAFG